MPEVCKKKSQEMQRLSGRKLNAKSSQNSVTKSDSVPALSSGLSQGGSILVPRVCVPYCAGLTKRSFPDRWSRGKKTLGTRVRW